MSRNWTASAPLFHGRNDSPSNKTSLARAARHSVLALNNLCHRAIRLIDGLICVGVSARIGIRNGDSSMRLAGHFTRRLAAFEPERIPQRVVFVGIAVRPAIYRNGGNVARRIQ